MRVGIVGNGANKFTALQVAHIHHLIGRLLDTATAVVSGGSPLGGVDEWAEEMGITMGLPLDIKRPKQHSWNGEYGYKQRNLDIARDSAGLDVRSHSGSSH